MIDFELDFCRELFDFEERFGSIGHINLIDDNLSYQKNGSEDVFAFPKNITKKEVEELYKKSLKDNVDYVLEYLKHNGVKLNFDSRKMIY